MEKFLHKSFVALYGLQRRHLSNFFESPSTPSQPTGYMEIGEKAI